VGAPDGFGLGVPAEGFFEAAVQAGQFSQRKDQPGVLVQRFRGEGVDIRCQRVETPGGKQRRSVGIQQIRHLSPGFGFEQVINGRFGVVLLQKIPGCGAIPGLALGGGGLLTQEVVENVMITQPRARTGTTARIPGGFDHEQILPFQVGQHCRRIGGSTERIAGFGR